jgi:hypothetical protein
LVNAGEHKKAVQKLWVVEANARTDLAEATALLELATRLSQLTTGSARNHAQLLVGNAESHINRLTAPRPTLRRSRVSCVALGGFGWDITVGRPYELDFDERAVTIHEPTTGETTTTVGYTELLAVEIGGPGARTSGGGFAGGGFGVENAAQGVLAASVLNAITSRTEVTTIFSLHTVDGEAFFMHDELTPQDLRIRLSEVFVRMRQAKRLSPDRGSTDHGPASDP